MWKTQTVPVIKTKDVVPIDSQNDDDWDTDADFVNNVSEKEQRWGSKTVVGSGRQAYIEWVFYKDYK
jgi:cortactin